MSFSLLSPSFESTLKITQYDPTRLKTSKRSKARQCMTRHSYASFKNKTDVRGNQREGNLRILSNEVSQLRKIEAVSSVTEPEAVVGCIVSVQSMYVDELT
jgi:hypothetical protein